jgi:hypothetical protein
MFVDLLFTRGSLQKQRSQKTGVEGIEVWHLLVFGLDPTKHRRCHSDGWHGLWLAQMFMGLVYRVMAGSQLADRYMRVGFLQLSP